MIRSVLRINAPRERVFAILSDYRRYKEWLPGCEHSAVVSEAERSVDVELVINMFGRLKVGMRFEAEAGQVLTFRMISGTGPKSYVGSYRLKDASDGRGTILVAEMRIELAVFVPSFIINHYARRSMDETGRSLNRYLKQLSLAAPPGQGAGGDSIPL